MRANAQASAGRIRVLLLSKYGRLGASSRVRSYQYLPFLAEQGIDVSVRPLLSDQGLRRRYELGQYSPWWVARMYASRVIELLGSKRYDLLWIEKELFPWLPPWAEQLLARLGVPYVVDYDDAVFHRYDAHPSRCVRCLLGKKIDAVMRNARLVIAGNEYLAGRARRAGARCVAVMPSVVDLRRYKVKSVTNTSGSFVVGWMGSPSTSHYVRSIQAALAALSAQGDAKLIMVGGQEERLEGVTVERHEWSEDSEAAEMLQWDVGIMPLTAGQWEEGKCGYKLIQYMACGLPVIASPVGVNREIVEHGVNGFLAETPDEWLAALMYLWKHPEIRTAMGREGRRKVEAKYSLASTAPILATLLERAAKPSLRNTEDSLGSNAGDECRASRR